MKPSLNPSYISKSRHGIYYFRCRIPLEVKKQYNISRNEVRKSLRTSNYSEALRKARKLWVEMTYYNDIDEMYHDIERHDEMLDEGATYYKELQEIKNQKYSTPNDERNYIDTLTNHQQECLIIATKHFEAQAVQHPTNSKVTNIDLTELHSKVDTLSKKVTDDGLKEITINEATKQYYDWYIQDRLENKDKDTPEKSLDDKIRALKIFSLLLGGDKILKRLDQEVIEKLYVPRAKNIPYRLDTIYKDTPNQKVTDILEKHLKEILTIGLSQGRKSKSKSLLNREFGSIKMFLEWAEKRKYIAKQIFPDGRTRPSES